MENKEKTQLQLLLEQRDQLESKIQFLRKEERVEVIQQVRELVATYELEPSQIFGGTKPKKTDPAKTVAPKYRDPETGATWTGRGKPPVWIAGKDRTAFAI